MSNIYYIPCNKLSDTESGRAGILVGLWELWDDCKDLLTDQSFATDPHIEAKRLWDERGEVVLTEVVVKVQAVALNIGLPVFYTPLGEIRVIY